MLRYAMKTNQVRVRYAPSPTGLHHIGGARTALFTWLFAKSQERDPKLPARYASQREAGGRIHPNDPKMDSTLQQAQGQPEQSRGATSSPPGKGVFILRIEDTDRERSKPEFEEDIKNTLTWLGIDWDEIYRQSERSSLYEEHLKKLFDDGWVYYCFCTKEELEAERQAMRAQGLAPKYSGRCRHLTKEEIERKLGAGPEKSPNDLGVKEPYVLRLKMPETKLTFKDLIRGQISFDTTLIGDVIVAKDFNQPLYNFAVVVDDALMNITHVIRGEEHISNTPIQIIATQALGFSLPQFAHLPLILNPDRSKMSKRFADTAIHDYIKQGYLKEAMINFLAFLGWHPKEDKEVMSLDEIIKEFDLKRVQKGGAVFNVEKLDWLNGYYLRHLDVEELVKRAQEFVSQEWQLTPLIINSVKGRIEKLSELQALIHFYFELPKYETNLLRWRNGDLNQALRGLNEALILIEALPGDKFKDGILEEEILKQVEEDRRGDVLWPLRVALSGQAASPGPFEIMGVLGKEESIKRVKLAIDQIKQTEEK